MESKLPEILDARGDQGALEIKSPWIRGLLHSDVDYTLEGLTTGKLVKDQARFDREIAQF